MIYGIEFEIAGLIIGIVILIFNLSKKTLPNLSNKLYRMMIVNIIITMVLCIFSCITVSYPYDFCLVTNHIANVLYLASTNVTPFLFYEYVLSLTAYKQSVYGSKKLRIVLAILPFCITILSIISSPITKLAYVIDSNRVYHQGPMMIYMYCIAVFYIIISIICMYKYRKAISKNRLIACLLFVFLTVGAVIIQFFVEKLLITDFSCMCACLIFYLLLQNPEESIDKETGLFNRNAFMTTISELVSMDKTFRVISISPDNLKNINVKFGYDGGNIVLREIGQFLTKTCSQASIYRLEGDNFALLIEDVELSSEVLIRKIQEGFRKPWQIDDRQIYMTACICCMAYPENAADVQEIVEVIKYSIIEAKSTGEGTVIYAKEHIVSREKKINELEKQKVRLEKLQEEAFKAKSRAEQADKAKTVFLANASHEIRTPMNTIIGMTDLILKEDISDTVRSNADEIKKAGASLVNMINNIMDVSKIESGKAQINQAPYQLSKVIRETVSLINHQFDNDNVEFTVSVNPKLPDNLIGDESRLKQVLLNLLSNAFKFTNKGKVSFIVDGTIIRDSIQLECTIEDTGIGISEEDMPQLFTNFTRLNWNETKHIEGTGLGLSICKKIVELLGGDIKATSVLGHGSTFSFVIKQKIKHMYSLSMPQKSINSYKSLVFGKCYDNASAIRSILTSVGIENKSLGVDGDLEEALSSGRINNIFLDYPNYKKYKKLLASFENVLVIVLLHRKDPSIRGNAAVSLRMPIYCINVIKALDSVSDIKIEQHKDDFLASEATALIVDDNEVNLRVAKGLIESYGVKVQTANSGLECLEALKYDRFDIVFLDQMMPGLSGTDTLIEMKNMNNRLVNETPVVALTANAEKGMAEKYMEVGFSDYIAKPIDIKQLEGILKKFLGSKIVITNSKKKKEKQAPEELLANLPTIEIDGIDSYYGLEKHEYDVVKYIDILEIAHESGQTKISIMKKAIENNDFEAYRIEVHALKSVCELIGAKELGLLAKSQEARLKEAKLSDIDSVAFINEANNLIAIYEKLVLSIEKFLKNKESFISKANNTNLSESDKLLESTKQVELTQNQIRTKILSIIDEIEDFEDTKALDDLLELLNHKLNGDLKNELETSIRALKIFNYDEAILVLKGLT